MATGILYSISVWSVPYRSTLPSKVDSIKFKPLHIQMWMSTESYVTRGRFITKDIYKIE